MKKRIVFLFLAILLCVLGTKSVFAYDDDTTHPALTDVVIDMYNKLYQGDAFSATEKEWVIQGSILEDEAPRWINHFYDPVSGEGWNAEHAGSLDSVTMNRLSKVAISSKGAFSAKDWVHNENAQKAYKRYGGNHTWESAIRAAADGDMQTAYISLGYVLHIVEDMAVPDHTRNDSHGDTVVTPGDFSPYEEYAKRWTRKTIRSNQRIKILLQGKAQPPYLSALDDHVHALADYSNKNFVSKDTISNEKYSFPVIGRECDDNFCYWEGLKLTIVPKLMITSNGLVKDYLFTNSSQYEQIFDSYFNRLSEQAILHCVDVLRLFRKGVKDELENREYPQHAVVYDFSFLPALLSSNDPLPLVSPVGEYKDFEMKAADVEQNILKAGQAIEGVIKSLYGSLSSTAGKVVSTTQETWQFIASSSDTSVERLRSVIDVRKDVNDVQSSLAVVSAGLGDTNKAPDQQVMSGMSDYKEQQVVPPQPIITTQPVQLIKKDAITQSNDTNEFDVQQKDDSVQLPIPVVDTSLSPQLSISDTQQQCSFEIIGRTFSWEVVINEVAWMGTQNSSSDEWMEIANVSGASMDVSGWQLLDAKEQIRVVFPDGITLAPGGFLLLERTDDTTIPNVAADIIYKGSLSNSNEGLRLFDANCKMMDEALASPSWPAGSSGEKRTMERTGRGFYGVQQWHSSSIIGGTPRQVNSDPYRPTSTGGGVSNVTHYVVVSDATETQTDTVAALQSGTTTPPITEQMVPPDIHITEIMYDVEGGDDGKEWIEVYNAGSESASFDTLNLYENETNHRIVCTDGCVLPTGAYGVIVSDKEIFIAEYPDYNDGVLAKSSFFLSNSGEPLALVYGEGHIFDVAYLSSQGASSNGLSLQEINGTWVESMPTPGRENVFVEMTVTDEGENDTTDVLSEHADDSVVESVDGVDIENTDTEQIMEDENDDVENPCDEGDDIVTEQGQDDSGVSPADETTVVEDTTTDADDETDTVESQEDVFSDVDSDEETSTEDDTETIDEDIEDIESECDDISETDECVEHDGESEDVISDIVEEEQDIVIQPVSGLSIAYNEMSRLVSIIWDAQDQEDITYIFDCLRDGELFDHTSFAYNNDSYSFYLDREDTGALFSVSLYMQDSLGNVSDVTIESIVIPEFIVREANHIVISEILFDAEGSDTGKEFVELYNPTNEIINLSGLTLTYVQEEQEEMLVSFGSKEEDIVTIAPKSFLLIGLNNYDKSFFGDRSADVTRSVSLPNGGSAVTLVDGHAVDSVMYTSASVQSSGQSMERVAWSNYEQVSPLPDETGEFLGNGYDSDVMDDFVARSPQPQNSSSLPEPRSFAHVDEWSIAYNKNTLSLGFDFPEYPYEVTYILAMGDAIMYEGVEPHFSTRITEVGMDYTFSLQMIDVDGLVSNISSKSIHVPSFLSQLSWYQTPFESRYIGESNALLEFSFDTYPFLPQGLVYNRYPHGGPYDEPNYKLIAFYLNDEDIPEEIGDAPYSALDEDTLQIRYRNCYGDTSFRRALVLADSDISDEYQSGCFYNEPLFSNLYFMEGDTHLTFPVSRYDSSDNFSADDRVTIAYYGMEYPPYDPLPVSFKLLATERLEYAFAETSPIHERPSSPAVVDFSFNEDTSVLTTTVSGSTDIDTMDAYIKYEISYDGGESWEDELFISASEKMLSLGETYAIAVRAVDDFGLRSDILLREFTVPYLDPPLTISNIYWGNELYGTPTLSFSYTSYPFYDHVYGIMIVYVNSLPPFPCPRTLSELNAYSGTNRLVLSPPQLCYGDSNRSYISFSGIYEDETTVCNSRWWISGLVNNMYFPPLDIHEGGEMALRIQGIAGNESSVDSLNGDDYITLGFYSMDFWGNVSLLGNDTHKYYFEQ